MDTQKLIELHTLGKTDSEIALILGVSDSLIWLHRKKLGLTSNFSYDSFRKIDYNTVIDLIKLNKTDKEISIIVGMHESSIWRIRKVTQTERESFKNRGKYREPTLKQKEILIGTLLGDASLRIGKGCINPSLSCEHGIKQKEYCEWKYKELESLGGHFSISKRKTVDPRTGIYYESAVFHLHTNPAYLPLYNALYKNNKKVIPFELLDEFTPLSLAVQFMDDGAACHDSIMIATNCFREDELEKFIEFLYLKFNLCFTICGSHQIYLLKKSANHFKELVLPYMHNTLFYKLSHVTP